MGVAICWALNAWYHLPMQNWSGYRSRGREDPSSCLERGGDACACAYIGRTAWETSSTQVTMSGLDLRRLRKCLHAAVERGVGQEFSLIHRLCCARAWFARHGYAQQDFDIRSHQQSSKHENLIHRVTVFVERSPSHLTDLPPRTHRMCHFQSWEIPGMYQQH